MYCTKHNINFTLIYKELQFRKVVFDERNVSLSINILHPQFLLFQFPFRFFLLFWQEIQILTPKWFIKKVKIWDSTHQFRTTGHPTHISPFSFVDLFLWFSILPLSFSWVFVVAPIRERLQYPLLSLGQMVSVASWELKFLDQWTQSWAVKCCVQSVASQASQWSQVLSWAKKYNF